MDHQPELTFKVATEPWEFEQVHRLNYTTFVEEIPQHSPNPNRVLVDKLLAQSTCFICLDGSRLVGMVTVCGQRPFSLDAKLPDLDSYLPPSSRPCEVRLLAIQKEYRGAQILGGLLVCLIRHCRDAGYTVGLISAAASQQRLYRHLGFVPFGPLLGTVRVPFQGMYITWETLAKSAQGLGTRSQGFPLPSPP
ncbi:MAG: GNAT family N-acetyltransferase [candidate division NC10 bacterium]